MKHINTVQISDTHYVCKALHTPPPHPFLLCVCVCVCTSLFRVLCVCEGKPLVCPSFYIHIACSSLLCSSCVVELCELDILLPPRPLYTQRNCADHRRIILIYYVLHTEERNSVKSRERDGMAHIIQTSYFFFLVVSPSSPFCVYEHKQNRFSIFGMSHHTVRLWTVCLVTLY